MADDRCKLCGSIDWRGNTRLCDMCRGPSMTLATLIPADKSIKVPSSIVDEMARAIDGALCDVDHFDRPCHRCRARAAAAVVAKRLRAMGFTGDCGPHGWMWEGGRCPGDALLRELEGAP